MLTADDVAKIQAMPDGPMKAQFLAYAQSAGGAPAPSPAPADPNFLPHVTADTTNPVLSGVQDIQAQVAKIQPAPPHTVESLDAAASAPTPPTSTAMLTDAEKAHVYGPSAAASPKGLAGASSGMPAGPAKPKGPRDYISETFDPTQQGLMGEHVGLMGKIGDATQAQVDAVAEGAHAKANLLTNAKEDAENQAEADAKRETERQTFIQHALDIQQKETDALAQQKVDPDHYWADKSTAGKIFAAIGLVLGGFGAAGTNGVNMAVKTMEGAIDRDIETQKANIASGHAALASKRNLLADRMKAFGDERMAEASAKAEFWQGIQTKIASIASGTEDKNAQAMAEKLGYEAKLQQNQYEQQIYDYAKGHVEAKDAAAAAGAAALAKEKKDRDKAVFSADLAAKQEWLKDAQIPGASITLGANGMPQVVAPMLDAQGNVTGYQHITPTGKPGADKAVPVSIVTGYNGAGEPIYTQGKTSADRAKNLDEASRTFTDMKRDIGIVRSELAEHPHGALPILSTEARARADAAVGRARLAMAQLAHLGALSESDYKQIEKQLPSGPLDVWGNTGATKVKVDEFEKSLDAKYKAGIETAIPGSTPKALPLTKPKE